MKGLSLIAEFFKNKKLFTYFFLGLALRLIFMPISFHRWEAQTWVNVGYDVLTGINPYTHFLNLPKIGSEYYGYWAYPPLFLYILLPFYKIIFPYRTPFMFIETTEFTTMPLFVNLILKLPMLIFDIAIAFLLFYILKPKGADAAIKGVALWMLNPLSIFITSIWGNFESIPIFFTLLSLITAKMAQTKLSATSLALGIAAKIYPATLLPLYMLSAKKKLTYIFTCIVAVFLVCSPFLFADVNAFIFAVLKFHSERIGGCITFWAIAWLNWFPRDVFVLIQNIFFLVSFLVFQFLLYRKRSNNKSLEKLNVLNILYLLAFILSSKLVNEQYALWIIPFFIIYFSERKVESWYYVYTIFPLFFIALNASLNYFFFGIHWHFPFQYEILVVLGIAFYVLCFYIFYKFYTKL
jgi:uncharacterized membrane protein